MRVNDDLALVILKMDLGSRSSELNLCVILDPEHGASLVDAGLPGSEDGILQQLAQLGIQSSDLKRILVTHHDIDHIGSLHALRERTGAKVCAMAMEVPYIDGTKPPLKLPPPDRLAQMPEFKAMLDAKRPTTVDEVLTEGQVLPLAGGVRVVETPGHTLGHTSFYLERTKSLITGDALTSADGRLNGPSPSATPDMATAIQSAKKLANLDVETIVCFHGGVVDHDANAQLKRVAEGP